MTLRPLPSPTPPLIPTAKRLPGLGTLEPTDLEIVSFTDSTTATATRSSFKLADGAPSGDPLVVFLANGDVGNQFRYSADDDLYLFNPSTKGYSAPVTYRAIVSLNDGTTFRRLCHQVSSGRL